MIKKKFISDHDIELFKEAFKDTHPLKQKHAKLGPIPTFKQKAIKPFPSSLSTFSTKRILPSDIMNEPTIKSYEKLSFARTGLQQRQIQKLKKGQIPIAASIDLHGLRFHEAHDALEIFFSKCKGAPQHCFCIIHGKGQDTPILKNLVNQFLKQQDEVLAFCSAPIRLGGTGATLFLLKST